MGKVIDIIGLNKKIIGFNFLLCFIILFVCYFLNFVE